MVKGLIATLFETGGRISEVLELTKDHFQVNGEFVRLYGIPVLKKGKNARPIDRMRNIPIRLDDPLTAPMLEWLEKADGDKLFPRSRIWAWQEIQKVSDSWWPHRFRIERATQLVIECGYNVPLLMRFFNWSDTKTPTNYVRLDITDLETAMTRREQ